MLSLITASKWEEWKAFNALDPIGEERNDLRFASIPLGIRKHIAGSTVGLDDFLLSFGDAKRPEQKIVQPLEHQERLINSWIFGSNAVFLAKEARKK